MATKITSTKEILESLNAGSKDWQLLPSLYKMDVVYINEKLEVAEAGSSVAVKCFVNKKTGEVKTFIAKWLSDVPETINLP